MKCQTSSQSRFARAPTVLHPASTRNAQPESAGYTASGTRFFGKSVACEEVQEGESESKFDCCWAFLNHGGARKWGQLAIRRDGERQHWVSVRYSILVIHRLAPVILSILLRPRPPPPPQPPLLCLHVLLLNVLPLSPSVKPGRVNRSKACQASHPILKLVLKLHDNRRKPSAGRSRTNRSGSRLLRAGVAPNVGEAGACVDRPRRRGRRAAHAGRLECRAAQRCSPSPPQHTGAGARVHARGDDRLQPGQQVLQ